MKKIDLTPAINILKRRIEELDINIMNSIRGYSADQCEIQIESHKSRIECINSAIHILKKLNK